MWKIDPNKNAYYHIHIQNMFPKVGLLEEAKEGGREEGGGSWEENDREWIILKYTTSL
jgi:hypothetical protein